MINHFFNEAKTQSVTNIDRSQFSLPNILSITLVSKSNAHLPKKTIDHYFNEAKVRSVTIFPEAKMVIKQIIGLIGSHFL